MKICLGNNLPAVKRILFHKLQTKMEKILCTKWILENDTWQCIDNSLATLLSINVLQSPSNLWTLHRGNKMCFHGSAKIRESCFGSVLNEYLFYLLGQFYHSSFGFKVVGSKIYSMNTIQQLSGKTHLGTVFLPSISNT